MLHWRYRAGERYGQIAILTHTPILTLIATKWAKYHGGCTRFNVESSLRIGFYNHFTDAAFIVEAGVSDPNYTERLPIAIRNHAGQSDRARQHQSRFLV